MSALIQGVLADNVSMIADIIEFGATDNTALPALIREIEQQGVIRLVVLKPMLVEFLAQLIGHDPDDEKDQKRPAGKPITFAEHFTELFEFATGWLHWTPETAWNASPAEIVAAQRGHFAQLRMIYGSTEEQEETSDPFYQPTPDEIADGLARLKANAQRGKR